MELTNYDLAADAENGFSLELIDPKTGKKAGVTIEVIGSDSKVYRKAKNDSLRRMSKAIKDGKEIDNDVESVKLYAPCVTGWSGFTWGGESFEYSKDNAVKLLTQFGWIIDQVSVAVEKRSNFTKKPKSN